MPKLFVGNFDFEYQLGRRPLQQLTQKLQEINRRLLPQLLPLTEPGDFVWSPEEPSTISSEAQSAHEIQVITSTSAIPANVELELVPWGWTAKLLEWGQQQQWRVNAPPLEAVAHANSRVTSCLLEQKWQTGPAELAVIHTVDELESWLQQSAGRVSSMDATVQADWILKAEYGMSSRERLFVRGNTMSVPERNWTEKRLQREERLILEPWLDRVAERSFHFDIEPAGIVHDRGSVGLVTDAAGRYLRNELFDESESTEIRQLWQTAGEVTRRAAESLAAQGYFGPLSIDSMLYRNGERLRIRPLQDINARWSMGRCELARIARRSR